MNFQKYYLCLKPCTDPSESEVWVQTDHPSSDSLYQGVRTSPIYALSTTPIITNPLEYRSGFILFCFTLDSFYSLGVIEKYISNLISTDQIFFSHGLASILIFFDRIDLKTQILSLLKDLIVGWEIWEIGDGKLKKSFPGVPKIEPQSLPCLPFERLDIENRIVFSELWASLSMAHGFAKVYAPQYISLLETVKTTGEELLFKILYLQDKINIDEIKCEFSSIYPDGDPQVIENELTVLQNNFQQPKDKFIRIHQLKDEAIQISAVLKNFNSQAFGGMSPIACSNYESGENSLLGIGGAVASLLSTYEHVRNVFSAHHPEISVIHYFGDMGCPRLLDVPVNYHNWKRELKTCKGIDEAIKRFKSEVSSKDIAFHLVYFSNRLGYRTTKHSISAAFQSVFLGYLPPYSLSTLSHEYVHAHISPLLGFLYPLRPLQSDSFNEIYEKYSQSLYNPLVPENLFDFLLLKIMRVVHKLYFIENDVEYNVTVSRKPLPIDRIHIALKNWHHEIDEVIVHILDYHYFYQSDPDTYIKAIWLSWLALPFGPSRIHEYLLRTICAISSNQAGNQFEKFDWSLRKIESQIQQLTDTPLFDPSQVSMVLNILKDPESKRRMKDRFSGAWCPLVEVVYHFLISSQIKGDLAVEYDSAFKADGPYSYELSPGVYEERRIESPITFMLENLRKSLDNISSPLERSKVEYLTLWMLHIMSSSMLGNWRKRVSADGRR